MFVMIVSEKLKIFTKYLNFHTFIIYLYIRYKYENIKPNNLIEENRNAKR